MHWWTLSGGVAVEHTREELLLVNTLEDVLESMSESMLDGPLVGTLEELILWSYCVVCYNAL